MVSFMHVLVTEKNAHLPAGWVSGNSLGGEGGGSENPGRREGGLNLTKIFLGDHFQLNVHVT